jgi:hypothetical protein
MVSTLAIRPKVCRFTSGWGEGFLRAMKIHIMPSFRGEVKPGSPCHKILWYVKESLSSTNKNTLQGQIHHSLHPFLLLATRWLLVGLLESSGDRIRSQYHSTVALHSHISPGRWTVGLLVATVQRRSITTLTWWWSSSSSLSTVM